MLAYDWCWLLFAVWIVWCCHSGSCYYWKKCSNCESHLLSLRIRQLFNYVVYIIFLVSLSAKIGYAANSSPEVKHVSFMSHLKKYVDCIYTKYAAEICGKMIQHCLKPTTPSHYAGVQTHGWCHSVGNQMVEVMKPNRIR